MDCSSFSCVIVGDGSLPLQCAEILRSKGHRICCIISSDVRLIRWATTYGIASGSTPQALLEQAEPFDFLFSIVNQHVLAAALLALPRRWAINYHDAPLPRYGGSHATSWALLAGETTYAITWHLMAEQVDAGDILIQAPVPITAADTALTLNLKCYDAALDAFTQLVDDLATQQVEPQPQQLAERSFFYARQPLPQAGVIDWSASAEALRALVNALQFGPYPNRLGLPKILCAGQFVCVTGLKCLATRSPAAPGTLLELTDTLAIVATATLDVQLTALQTLDGYALPIAALSQRYGLRRGDQLGQLAAASIAQLLELHKRVQRHEHFWVRQLRQLQPLSLTALRPLPAAARFATLPLELPSALLECMAQQADQPQTDRLLALVVAFLLRLTGVQTFDIALRTPALATLDAECASLYATAVPLRVAPERSWDYAQLLEHVQATRRRVLSRQTYARDVYARYPELRYQPLRIGVDIVDSPADDDAGSADPGYELIVQLDAAAQTCRWIYNASVLQHAEVECLAQQFLTFVGQLVAQPKRRIDAIELLAQSERRRLLEEWNATQTDYPAHLSVQQLVERQAARTPQALALADARQQRTYAELDRQARQYAAVLRAHGVGPEVVVAVLIERSCELVVALLATLYAGAAYLPLDPALPPERLAWMLADSQAQLLATTAAYQAHLPALTLPTVLLDQPAQVLEPLQAARPAAPHNLAYMIYTSGSTGRPKGVLVTQQGLLNLALGQIDAYGVQANSRLLQLVSPSFDVASGELFTALLAGAALYLAAPQGLRDTAELLELLARYAITHVGIPPAILALLTPPELPQLKVVITGGEPCPIEVVERWATQRAFFNAYGPTETTVTATVARYGADAASLPIGRPLANTQLYVLDAQLQLVPIGAPGELYIGGVGVARGYQRRAALTAERFIPDPFSAQPGARMYRTGDWVRYRSDGQLEFLGRIDDQVKLRGYRIELAEIEQVLNQHPAVQHSAVIVSADQHGHQRLAAYIAAKAAHVDQPNDQLSAELRRYLQARLPEYMLPVVWIKLDIMPLTPSGKIDRRALPAPAPVTPASRTVLDAPRTPAETQLAAIWAAVLGLDQVGRSDNFFELGGDSILGIQIVTRARQAGLYLRTHQLFAHPTVAELAAVIDSAPALQAEQGLVVGTAPLLPIQHWLLDRDHTTLDHWNSAEFLVVPAELDLHLLEQALAAVLRHHDALRTRFVYSAEHSRWQQHGAAQLSELPLVVADLSTLAAADLPAAIEVQARAAQQSLSLQHGPLLRVVYFNLGAERPGRLLVLVHHIVMDIVSWRILLEDLATAYAQLRRAEPVRLAAKTTAYQAWAKRLAAHANAASVLAELPYWTDPARQAAAELPRDHCTGPNIIAAGRRVKVALRADETHALVHELPTRLNVNVSTLLVAALVQTLAQWSGRTAVLINLRGHGREDVFADVDLTRTLGWFTTITPVLFTLPAHADVLSLVHSVHERINAVPNHGLGYGLLRYLATAPQALAQRAALVKAEVNFNYVGQLDRAFASELALGPANESPGPLMSPRSERAELLDVVGRVGAGRLRVAWNYSVNYHREETIVQLAQMHLAVLRQCIASAQALSTDAHTVSAG